MTGYIKTMRGMIGHAPILQCGASVILLDENNRVLLQKRADSQFWGYHGGSVELDEVVEEAAKRELFEETGLIAEELELFGVFSGPGLHHIYPNGDEVSNIDTVFLCRKWHGELKRQEEEVLELKFFPPNQLPEPIFPPNQPALLRFAQWAEANL